MDNGGETNQVGNCGKQGLDLHMLTLLRRHGFRHI